jgi:hypothetical protein
MYRGAKIFLHVYHHERWPEDILGCHLDRSSFDQKTTCNRQEDVP